MSTMFNDAIIKFYVNVRSMLGMGELWMKIDDPDYVTCEWYPRGSRHTADDPYLSERVCVEMIVAVPVTAERIAVRMREAYRSSPDLQRHAMKPPPPGTDA